MEPKKGKEIFGSGINFLPQWAKIIIGLSILALLFFWIGIEKTLEALSGFKMIYLALAFVIFGAILFLNITGIFLLTSCVKKTGFKEMGIAYLSSWAIGFMLPGKFGDYAFAPLMQKHGFKTGEGIAVITLDKMITFAIILSGAIFGTLFFVADQLIILLLAVFILATCTLLLFTEKGRSLLKKAIPKNLTEKFEGFSAATKKIFSCRKAMALNFALTVFRIVLQTFMLSALFLGFGFSAGFPQLFFIFSMSTIISLIPITFSGLGLREGSFIYLSALFGLPLPIAGSVTLIALFLDYCVAGIIITWNSFR